MKKLTKVLSLVLVVAMVLSLCVIGAGATFTDNGKINKDYTEATTIVNDLGVIKGFTDGSFQPAGTLTRAQAAVILAKMTVGSAADTLVYTSKTFKDVPASFWGYKYIEYAAAAGLVAGTGNGNFSPNATLTGYQWALMVLKALGYTNEAHGITGANWAINTAKLYYGVKLSSVSISAAPITREEASQIAYDALFFGTVPSTKGTTTIINGVTVTTGSTEGTLNTAATLALSSFGVTKAPLVADDFGRPGTVYTASTIAQGTAYGWTNKTKTIASVPTLSYTTKVTSAKVFSDLGLTADVTHDNVTTYVDGKYNATTALGFDHADSTGAWGANGALTEVYYNATTGKATVVVMNTYIGSVTTVTAATAVTKANVTVTGDVTASNGFTSGTYTTTAFAKDDVVLYTVAETAADTFAVESMQKVTPTSMTATGMSSVSFTAGGKTYMYSAYKSGTIAAADVTGKVAKDVYLDNYGYAIKVANPTSAVPQIAVVVGAYTGTGYTDTYNVKLLMVDGKTVDVVATAAAGSTTYEKGNIVSYAVNANGTYTLTTVAKDVAGAATVNKNATNFKTAKTLDGSATTETTTAANAKTIFFVKTVTNGVTSYATYVGVANVPSCTTSNSAVYASDGVAVAAYLDTATATNATTTMTDVIYVTPIGAVTYTDATLGTYTSFNAVVNGTIGKIMVAGDYSAATGTNAAKTVATEGAAIYVSGSKDANGVYTALNEMNSANTVAYTQGAVGTGAAANGVVTLGTGTTVSYNDASAVYTVAADGTIAKSTVSAVTTDINDTVVYYTTSYMLTSAFITSVPAAK